MSLISNLLVGLRVGFIVGLAEKLDANCFFLSRCCETSALGRAANLGPNAANELML